jgi:hypothetical protein
MSYITNKPFLQADDMEAGSILDSAVTGRKRWQRASDGLVRAIDAPTGTEFWNDPATHDGGMEAAIVTDDGFMIWDCAVAPTRIYRVIK